MQLYRMSLDDRLTTSRIYLESMRVQKMIGTVYVLNLLGPMHTNPSLMKMMPQWDTTLPIEMPLRRSMDQRLFVAGTMIDVLKHSGLLWLNVNGS